MDKMQLCKEKLETWIQRNRLTIENWHKQEKKKKNKNTVSTTPQKKNPTQTIKIAAIKKRNSREERKNWPQRDFPILVVTSHNLAWCAKMRDYFVIKYNI